MQSSDIVVAINKDAKAPIFNVADLGVVGNLEEAIPQLIEALEPGAVQS
jgi:electron transfer flavoprotein alpha subunit